MKTVELGDEVKCKVTGHRGIATAIAKCLTGCDRVEVKPPVDKDGKMMDGYWIDIAALEVVKKGKIKPEAVQEQGAARKLGGPPTRSTL
jgi:hypothetical protein